jgi:hypothetical protein
MGDQSDYIIVQFNEHILIVHQSLLPLLVVLVSSNELLPNFAPLPIHGTHDDAAKGPYTSSDLHSHTGSIRILVVATVSAGAVLAVFSVPTTSALGISSAIFAATGLVLFERVTWNVEGDDTHEAHDYMPANGTAPRDGPTKGQQLAALRDVTATMAVLCGLASLLVEPSTNNAVSWRPVYRQYHRDWKTVNDFRVLQRILWMIPVNVLSNALMYIIVSFLSLILSVSYRCIHYIRHYSEGCSTCSSAFFRMVFPSYIYHNNITVT